MGFVVLALVGAASAALLWRLRLARSLWSLAGAALMLGATGYVIQGRPQLGGVPRAADATPLEVDPGLVEIRYQMFGRYGGDAAYLVAADAVTRSGDAASAMAVILGGIRKSPGNAMLWTALGETTARHDGDQVSPPALFAFQQATRLAPQHPGPPFFWGLAYVRAGRLAEAQPYWRRALALAPAGAPYRRTLGDRLLVLDAYLRQAGQLR